MDNNLSKLLDYLASDDCKAKTDAIQAKKARDFDDDTLALLWGYIQSEELNPRFGGNVDGAFSPFELNREEYGYCIRRIFGEASYEQFMEDTEGDAGWAECNSITKRQANSIMATYKRRGHHSIVIEKRKRDDHFKYLESDGSIKDEYKKQALSILEGKEYT